MLYKTLHLTFEWNCLSIFDTILTANWEQYLILYKITYTFHFTICLNFKCLIPYTEHDDTIFDLVIPFFWGLFNRFSHNSTIIVNHSHFSFDTNLTTRYHFYLHNGAVLSLHSAILLTIAMIQIIQTKNQFQKLFCTLIFSTDLLIKPIPAINIKTLLNNINFHWGVNL